MKKIFVFTFFLTTFLSVFFWMNFYFFYRVLNFFDVFNLMLFYLLVSFFTVSYLVSAYFEKKHTNMFSKYYYTFMNVWLGIVFYSTFILLFFELIIPIPQVNQMYLGLAFLTTLLAITLYSIINASFVKARKVSFSFQKDIDVVHISDLHVGTIRNSRFLKKVVDKINNLNPELVFITGDLVDGSGPLNVEMYRPLSKIKAPIYMCLGNHELYEGADASTDILKKAKINVLRNKVVEDKGVQIIGVDPEDRKGYLHDSLMQLSVNKLKPSILLFHLPKEIKSANIAGIDLMLSGHTHRGQIFPFNILTWFFYPNISGHYRYDKTHLYVSQGTGTWGPPMRLGSYNEITFIKLRKV